MTISRLRSAGAAILCAASAIAAAARSPSNVCTPAPDAWSDDLRGRPICRLPFGSGRRHGADDVRPHAAGSEFKRVTASEPEQIRLGWCRWANDKRLLCGLYGNIRGKKYAETPFRRLFAVDADGAALKVLEGSRNEANLLVQTTSMRNFNMNQGAEHRAEHASNESARGVGTTYELGRGQQLCARVQPRAPG